MQTTVRSDERLGRPGAPYSEPIASTTRIAKSAVRPGALAIRDTSAGNAGKRFDILAAPAAADDDAIMVAQALAAGVEAFSGASLDGVIGLARIPLPRNVTVKLNAHADWTAGDITIVGLDEFGRPQEEAIAVAVGGGATVAGKKFFSSVTEIDTPAGGGANRVLDVGTGTLLGPLTSLDVLGIVRYLAAREVSSDTEEYAAFDELDIIEAGKVWMEVEEDVLDGEQVFVRLVAGVGESVGALRNDRDGTAAAPDCVPVVGLRFFGDSVLRDGVRMCVVNVQFPNA